MAFVVTPITPLPTNPDGSIDVPTWGEGGGPFAVPADELNGYPGNNQMPSNDVNYEWQHIARHTRAAVYDQGVRTREGFFCSCVVTPDFESGFNLNGGTLNITLTPTRLVVDVDGDGGTVVEVKATLAAPQALPANSDNYVSFDEAGSVTVTSVGNGAPEPAAPVGEVFIWVLTTDGTELTDVDMYGSVPPFPCLGPLVGMISAFLVTLTVPDGGTVNVGTGVTFDVKEWRTEALGLVSGGTLPAQQGEIRNTGTWLAVADAGGARQRSLSDPRRGYAEGAGPFGAPTTVATTQRFVALAEPVDITITAGFTLSAASTLVVEIEVSGPGGTVSVLVEGIPSAAGVYGTMTLPKQVVPSSATGTLTDALYTFNFKLGAVAGDMTASHARIVVLPAYQT